ncbi:MAG: hypothetical protein KY053_02115, partial [Candidatus Liptonbacteria bacterium]|nr:hypothetical protein [Candidatus Liptonbacteria bacterium]
MVQKLRLLLKTPKLRLVAKSAAALLVSVFLPPWLGLPIFLFFYYYPFFPGFFLLFSSVFAFFLSRGFLTGVFLPDYFFEQVFFLRYLMFFIFFVVFFLILGLKNYLFTDRKKPYLVFLTLVLFFLFYGVFVGGISLWLAPFLLFFIIRDFLFFLYGELPPKRLIFISAFLVLIFFQGLWAVLWLNLPALLSALNVLVFCLCLLFVIDAYLKGILSSRLAILAFSGPVFFYLLNPVFIHFFV